MSVRTNVAAAFCESSQISEKLPRRALLRHLRMGNVFVINILYALALAFWPLSLKIYLFSRKLCKGGLNLL